MILSDRDIKAHIAQGKIKVTPLPDYAIQLSACMLDLHLGNSFRVFEYSSVPFIDTRGAIPANEIMREITVKDGDSFTMQPGELVLASTKETLELSDDIVGRFEGRSSLGRLGVIVHGTASVFHPGWIGVITLELGNIGRMPVKLYPNMRICAFTFEQLSSPAEVPYRKGKNKYAGQTSPLASKLAEEK